MKIKVTRVKKRKNLVKTLPVTYLPPSSSDFVRMLVQVKAPISANMSQFG
jgi:hypothetical protein